MPRRLRAYFAPDTLNRAVVEDALEQHPSDMSQNVLCCHGHVILGNRVSWKEWYQLIQRSFPCLRVMEHVGEAGCPRCSWTTQSNQYD